MEHTASFGYWLRRRRKALDLTQAELAGQVACSLDLIRKIEADARRPSRQLAERLATCLGLTVDERAAFIQAARAERAVDRLALPTQPVELAAAAAVAKKFVGDRVSPDTLPGNLGTHRLNALGLPEQRFQLAIPDQPAALPERKRSNTQRSNLPIPPTSLVGRDREVAALIELLGQADIHLVTLTGPGGIGKTRLALQVAANLIDAFADGVYFIDLAPIREPRLVITTIARTLGVQESGGQSLLVNLKVFLHDRNILLLIDNVEQVIEAAPLLAELLGAACQLKVLATSRQRLHLRGEKEVVVGLLALPDRAERATLDQLAYYTAVALFVQRAADASADFHLTSANAPAVAEICHRLDGLPLAIELAATRVKLFTPEALLAHLSSRLALLTGGPRDLPARQRTLRDAIAWSYDLLSDDEQALFRQLAVFVGGWTLEAAEAVTTLNVPALERSNVLDGLAALVDKSIIRHTEGISGAPRFGMLETIREYALERLEAHGDGDQVRQRHADTYLALAELATSRLHDAAQIAWLDRLEVDYDNVRAALSWYERSDVGVESELRLVGALAWFWIIRGYLSEGRDWLARALACGQPAANALRGHVLTILGYLQDDPAKKRASYEESVTLSRAIGDTRTLAFTLHCLAELTFHDATAAQLRAESLTLFRTLGDPWGIGLVLADLALAEYTHGAYTQAEALYAESLAYARAVGDPWLIARILESSGEMAADQGDHARANVLYAESLELARASRDRSLIAWTLVCMGHVARCQGDDAHAATCYAESLAVAQDMGNQFVVASVRHNQAYIALHRGDIPQAIACLWESLTICRPLDYQDQMAWGLATLGGVAAATARPEQAAWLLGVAEAHFTATNHVLSRFERVEHDRYIAAARAQLGESAFQAAWAAGAVTPVVQAVTHVLDEWLSFEAGPVQGSEVDERAGSAERLYLRWLHCGS